MTTNELLENMLSTCKTQEKSNKWISEKQVKFLVEISEAKQEFIPDRRWSKRWFINTNKYDITILISPQNNAGYLIVENESLRNERIKSEFNKQDQINKERIKYLEIEMLELKKENESTDWTQIPERIRKMLEKTTKDMEKKLNQLRG